MTVYTLTDATTINTVIAPTPYYVGADTRTALGEKAWPLLGDRGGEIPMDAVNVRLYATQDCVIYFLSSDLVLGQANGVYSAGLPASHYIVAGTQWELPVKCCIIYAARVLVDGVLSISFYA